MDPIQARSSTVPEIAHRQLDESTLRRRKPATTRGRHSPPPISVSGARTSATKVRQTHAAGKMRSPRCQRKVPNGRRMRDRATRKPDRQKKALTAHDRSGALLPTMSPNCPNGHACETMTKQARNSRTRLRAFGRPTTASRMVTCESLGRRMPRCPVNDPLLCGASLA